MTSLQNSYQELPEYFFERVQPEAVPHPKLLLLNRPLLSELQNEFLHESTEEVLAGIFSGNSLIPDSHPLALAYAGHQFGHFVPLLGDGRAVLLGEIQDKQGVWRDIQLKGSGRTKFSRRGDGKAPLGAAIREYIVSEAMYALGIPSTRSLAVVATGEAVRRDRVLPGAVLTRVASSHVRIGSFEFAAQRNDKEGLQALADYSIARHFPYLLERDEVYRAFLAEVIKRQASLVAQWMSVGFIHGVLNTDNIAISGETIDFGPCAFLDEYNKWKVFSSIDEYGRYAYGNQPGVLHWNLARLAECLIPLLHSDIVSGKEIAQEELAQFPKLYKEEWLVCFAKKFGFENAGKEEQGIMENFLELLEEHELDFTLSFRSLSHALQSHEQPSEEKFVPQAHAMCEAASWQAWMLRWKEKVSVQGKTLDQLCKSMCMTNPYVIPRNHRIEEAITALIECGDMLPLERLLQAVQHPFEALAGLEDFAKAPRKEEVVRETFCGT